MKLVFDLHGKKPTAALPEGMFVEMIGLSADTTYWVMLAGKFVPKISLVYMLMQYIEYKLQKISLTANCRCYSARSAMYWQRHMAERWWLGFFSYFIATKLLLTTSWLKTVSLCLLFGCMVDLVGKRETLSRQVQKGGRF